MDGVHVVVLVLTGSATATGEDVTPRADCVVLQDKGGGGGAGFTVIWCLISTT
jgi:hypothetical protein